MMRIPLQHATRIRYGIRFSRTISTYTAANQTLQHRIASALDRDVQIIPVLEQWRKEGNQVNPSHVRAIIKELRDSENSLQALKVSEWMSEEKKYNLMPEDYAARYNLIENVLGLEEAEKFFESIPKTARDDCVYTTLLTSYTRSDKTLCKAEATFQKMKELGFLFEPSPYNAMMSLYVTLENRDEVEKLLREMKDNNVKVDSVTVNNVFLKLYSAVSDVAEMEKFMNERDGVKLEWLTTLEMAKAYLRRGLSEKAIQMLKLTEELVDHDPKSLKSADELLMKLYGEPGEKEEVLRIWKLYKNIEECDNMGYRTVIGSLLKLDDIHKAEEIYKEWECLHFLEFDIEIPTMLAYGYIEKGMTEKAEKLMNNRVIKNKRMNEAIAPLLEKWGNQMKPFNLKCLIKNLHDSNQLSKALQVSQWMDQKRGSSLYSEDYAARLHIIENVLGLEEAEKFFESGIPENMKDYSVYATLLTSYARSNKTLDKAEATFKKMRELGFLLKPSPFNSMISLYSTQKNMVKVEEILGEMEENNVKHDSVTINNVLRAYAAESNVEAMEEFMRMRSGEEDGIELERNTIAAMANAYHMSGLITKAIEMYGDVYGSKGEVYRLWHEFKKREVAIMDYCFFTTFEPEKEKEKDDAYHTLFTSLLKLDDLQGAENIYYGEWKPNGPKLDLRIPGLLISRFFEEGNEKKVKELMMSIRVKRNGMRSRMLKRFAFKVIEGAAFTVFVPILVISDFLYEHPVLWFWFWF